MRFHNDAMKFGQRLALGLLGCWVVVVVGCGPNPDRPVAGQDRAGDRLLVVGTFFAMTSHAMAVAVEDAEVLQLLSSTAEPHGYQLSPGEVKLLGRARVLVKNGLGLEDWLDGVIQAAAPADLVVVDTSEGLNLIKSSEEFVIEGLHRESEEHPGHEHQAHSTHEHGSGCEYDSEQNPHIWLDPIFAIHQVEKIRDALITVDPKHAENYRNRTMKYVAELHELDAEFRELFARVENRNLVTFHEAFPYFAARYGLNYLGFVAEFPAKEPSPSQLRSLVEAIKANQVGVIFSEVGYDADWMATIARETGVRVARLNTLEVGEPSPDGYLRAMRQNLEALKAMVGSANVEQ